jgi:predicted nucleic acid-binding protein
MSVLVDTSVWIEYFQGDKKAGVLDTLIDEDLLVTNELILAELVPPLHLRGEEHLIALLHKLRRQPLAIEWNGIVRMRVTGLRDGINGVGLPDLIIAQNTVQGGRGLLSHARRLRQPARHFALKMHG